MPEYKIFDILSKKAEPNKKYLFDTNIWLSVLNARPYPKSNDKKYLAFLYSLKNSISSPKPKIVLPGFIISEIINAGLNIRFKLFQDKNKSNFPWTGNYKSDFKKFYRPTKNFEIDYELLCYELKNYHQYFEIVSDGFEDFKLKKILRDLPSGLDYNDYYFYLLAKKREYTIVTDDGDFFMPDVEVITANSSLLNKLASQA